MASRFLISRRDRQSTGTIPVFLLLTALRARARSAVRFLGIVNPIVVSNLRVSSPDIVTVKYFPFWRIVGIIENLIRAIETCLANFPLAVVREITELLFSTPPSVSNSPLRNAATCSFPIFRTNLGKTMLWALCLLGYWYVSSRNLIG